ncbi:hypothetical protein AB833_19350 [Chromatiales bacterium (ex Bugula neritina AB1)]|nr:hypothetical protein AB833_19350 [Chromatiales bacterium (ex Bugula neritina AB1)]
MSESGYIRHASLAVAGLALVVSLLATVWLLGFDGVQQLQNGLVRLIDHRQAAITEPLWIAVYALVCVVSQCLIVPSGSLILIVAGFVFGPLVATAVYAVAQVLTTWPVVSFSHWVLRNYKPRALSRFLSVPVIARAIATVGEEDFMASVVLRLTPVVPSAAACLLAVTFAIPAGSFMLATACVCWVRPLFFASIGAALQQLATLESALKQSEAIDPTPIVLVFLSSLLLLAARLWLRRK